VSAGVWKFLKMSGTNRTFDRHNSRLAGLRFEKPANRVRGCGSLNVREIHEDFACGGLALNCLDLASEPRAEMEEIIKTQ
jgi:hypothetical protein